MMEEIKKYIIRRLIKPEDFENLFIKLIDKYENKLSLINSLTNLIIKKNPKLESKRLTIYGQCALRLDEVLKQGKTLDNVAKFFRDTVIEINKIFNKSDNLEIENEDDEPEIEIIENTTEDKIENKKIRRRRFKKEDKKHIIITDEKELAKEGIIIKKEGETPEERCKRMGISINDSLGTFPTIIKKEDKDNKSKSRDLSKIARDAVNKVKDSNLIEDRNKII